MRLSLFENYSTEKVAPLKEYIPNQIIFKGFMV